MPEPKWHTGDMPRENEASVPVQTISREDRQLYEETLAAIALAQSNHLVWEHHLLEAIVTSRYRGIAEKESSEATTLIPMLAPDPHTLDRPNVDTQYSKLVPPTLDEQLAAYLTSDLPMEPPE